MPIEPKMFNNAGLDIGIETQKCTKCGAVQSVFNFSKTNSGFFSNGRLPICNKCVQSYLVQNKFSWQALDKLCQWADIPWVVREWTRIVDENGEGAAWLIYNKIFSSQTYNNLGWEDYDKQYRELKAAGDIDQELPLIHEERLRELENKWGSNYSEEELFYLEDLYKGLQATQNISGPLQDDQAKKICKISLEIDGRIRAGDKDVDKFLSSYDKLVKIAEFTPKNAKNQTDFDSWAELAVWLEKRGKLNKFYDGATRDVIDETLKNIQNYNQKLYINEGGIGEAITSRLEALQHANEMEESVYNLPTDFDTDEYDNAGFVVADEDFIVDLEDDANGND